MSARARLLVVAAVLVVVTATAAPSARAEGGPFGLGLMIGSPTAIAGKVYLGGSANAIDFGVGGTFFGVRGIHVHVDYLWHPVIITRQSGFVMPFYVGVGGRFLSHNRKDFESDAHIGARVPVGILFDFTSVPLDVFLEAAAIVDVIVDHGDRGRDLFDVNVALGARYYF